MSAPLSTSSSSSSSSTPSWSLNPTSILTSSSYSIPLYSSHPPLSSYHISQAEKKSTINWDKFYKRNQTHFYKDRWYLSEEFIELNQEINKYLNLDPKNEELKTENSVESSSASSATSSAIPSASSSSSAASVICPLPPASIKCLFEIGCGVGNSLFPLLDQHPSFHFYGCDCSKHAIDQLTNQPIYKENKERINVWVQDIVKEEWEEARKKGRKGGEEEREREEEQKVEGRMDYATLIFVLSALNREEAKLVLQKAWRLMKKASSSSSSSSTSDSTDESQNGVLFIRDYAIYDMAELRFSNSNTPTQLGPHFYLRQDGTRALFLSTEEITEWLNDAGFDVLKCEYQVKTVRNRKEGLIMKRRFVQVRARARSEPGPRMIGSDGESRSSSASSISPSPASDLSSASSQSSSSPSPSIPSSSSSSSPPSSSFSASSSAPSSCSVDLLATERRLFTLGYRDGSLESRETLMQSGFNVGWLLGMREGWNENWEKGVAAALACVVAAQDTERRKEEGGEDKDLTDEKKSERKLLIEMTNQANALFLHIPTHTPNDAAAAAAASSSFLSSPSTHNAVDLTARTSRKVTIQHDHDNNDDQHSSTSDPSTSSQPDLSSKSTTAPDSSSTSSSSTVPSTLTLTEVCKLNLQSLLPSSSPSSLSFASLDSLLIPVDFLPSTSIEDVDELLKREIEAVKRKAQEELGEEAAATAQTLARLLDKEPTQVKSTTKSNVRGQTEIEAKKNDEEEDFM